MKIPGIIRAHAGAKLIGVPHAPKLVKVSIAPGKTRTGGWAAKVTHMYHGGRHEQFNFADPMAFGKHLTKIARGQWRHPEKNEGGSIAHALDIAG